MTTIDIIAQDLYYIRDENRATNETWEQQPEWVKSGYYQEAQSLEKLGYIKVIK